MRITLSDQRTLKKIRQKKIAGLLRWPSDRSLDGFKADRQRTRILFITNPRFICQVFFFEKYFFIDLLCSLCSLKKTFFNKDFLFITITIITQLYSIKSTSYASNTLHFSNHVFPYYVFLFHT